MLDSEISTLCMQKHRQADTFTSELQQDRELSLKYYNCEPFGDEKDGESKFVTSDVRDTIEWMMPQIVEIFTSDESPVEFLALNAQDVESAKLETSYVNHVYNTQNTGFLNTYQWVKDGLLLKNGIVKSWWDEKVDEIEETYEGQDIVGYQKLLADPQIEIKEVTVFLGEQEYSLEEARLLPPEALVQAKFDVSAVRTEDNSKVQIKVIPPENFVVEHGHNTLDLDTVQYCCHRDEVTENDLIVDGYDKELVKSIPSGSSQDMDEETLQRFDSEGSMRSSATEDGAGRKIEIYEHYIRADLDESGKTSLWMVKLAGPEGAILLEKEKVDSIPFSAWTPVINCHKFYGMSYADMVRDLQRLRSVLMRQLLNNLYMVNHPAKTVLDGQVFKEDLLNTGPNAIWRIKSPDAIGTHMTPFVGEATLPVLSMVDEMRQERTGVSPASQGLDPSILADSTNLVGPMIMSQAMQRIKMVARIFAETGFKSLMLRIHELCLKHDHTRTFPIANDYHDVNPREWTKRTQYRVKVGVGHVDKIQRVQAIQAIIGNQTLITQAGGMEGPLLSAGNVYEALVEQAKLLGYVDGAKFYRNPEEYQPPEPQPSEAIQITEATTVADLTKSKASNDIELTKHADEMLLKKQKQDQDYDLAMRKLEQDKELKREEMLLQYGTKAGSNVGFEG